MQTGQKLREMIDKADQEIVAARKEKAQLEARLRLYGAINEKRRVHRLIVFGAAFFSQLRKKLDPAVAVTLKDPAEMTDQEAVAFAQRAASSYVEGFKKFMKEYSDSG